jgi:hypothetical protein
LRIGSAQNGKQLIGSGSRVVTGRDGQLFGWLI